MISFFVILLATAPLEPVSTRDGVLPVQVVDGADGICHYGTRNHLELVAVETGETKVTTAKWSRVLGELPDGALLVTNERVRKVKELRVAVLERATGAERFSCGFALDPNEIAFTWTLTDGGLRAEGYRTYPPSGIAQPREALPDMGMVAVGLTFSAKACSLTKKPVFDKHVTYAPLPVSTVPNLRTVTGPEFVDLEYLKDGKPLWTRHVGFGPQSCALP